MLGVGLRQSRHGNITITNRFDFENVKTFSDGIKGGVDGLKQLENLRRLSFGTPCCEASNIGKDLPRGVVEVW
jgi:hypothetical protein